MSDLDRRRFLGYAATSALLGTLGCEKTAERESSSEAMTGQVPDQAPMFGPRAALTEAGPMLPPMPAVLVTARQSLTTLAKHILHVRSISPMTFP